MKDYLSWTGSALALLLYIPTIGFIWTDKLKQSFATWFLWVALDGIALGSMLAQNGENTLVLKCYIFGGTLVWLSLLFKKQFVWGKKEWGTLSLVAVCLVVWYYSGPYWATIASTVAVCISAYPQYVESRDGPHDPITGRIYAGYGVANTLFFLAGKEWSVQERFYAGMVIPLCVLIAWAALRKRKEACPVPIIEPLV